MDHHTAVLFEPSVLANGLYQTQKPLTQEEIASAIKGQREITPTVHAWNIRGHEFIAKTIEDPEESCEEYDLSARLVEPPEWKKLSELEIKQPLALVGEKRKAITEEKLLTLDECASAEAWLQLRRKHPGFSVINHSRQYIVFHGTGFIVMDPCVCTLGECLELTYFFILSDQEKLKPNQWRHPLGQAVTQVLQGLHYLAYVAQVEHHDMHVHNVMLNSSDQWRIVDFGLSGATARAAEDVLCDDFSFFASDLMSRLHTDIQSDHVLVWDFIGPSLWQEKSHAIVRNKFNSICPWLGDLLLVCLSKLLEEEEPSEAKLLLDLPPAAKLVEGMAKRALNYSSFSSAHSA